VDFGSESVGGTLSVAVTIKNNGTNDLSIASSGFSIVPDSGTAAGIFSVETASALTIKSGATASVTLAFSPVAASSYSATLKIASNDIVQPSFAVKLSGSGSSTAKAFTAFGIQSPAETGAIDESGKAIALNVPYGTSVTGLIATFTTTGTKVLVGSSVQTSGQTANDFTNSVTYTVVAQDGSTADYKVSVSVGTVAPLLTTSSASSIGATSAISGGTITSNGGATVTETGICWSTSQNPTTSGSHAASSATSGSFTASMTGLSPVTTYYLRAYAINSVGTGYGAQVSFTTSADVPTLTTSSVSSIAAYTASCGGTISSDGGATISAAGICVSTSQNPTLSTSGVVTFAGSATAGTYTASMTNLSAYTTYYARAYATNSAGTGYGSPVSFTTLAGVPTVTTNASFSSITTTSAIGGGSITSNGGAAVTETGICWSSSNGTPTISNSSAASATVATSFTASLSSLSVGTTYYARAYAKNSAGYGYGSVVSFVTMPAAPVISSVATVGGAAGSGQLAVSWSAATGASAYNVYAYTSNTFSSASVIAGGSGLSSSTTSCTLTGLTNYTTYYVWVQASNASGSATSSSSTGYVGVPVTSFTIQRSADYVTVSGGRTADTLIWDTTQSTSSIDTLYAVASPSNATNTAVKWTSTGKASVTTAGVVSLTSNAAGTVIATPADGQGGTAATVTISYISAAKGATNYTGPGGGTVFYDKGSYSNGWRYMEVYYNSGKGICLYVPWGGYGTTTGATSTAIGTGKENTDTIISVLGSGGGYMAYYCRYSFANNGYSDWFLPSYSEVDTVRTVLGFANYTMFSCSTEYAGYYSSGYSWAYFNNYDGSGTVQWQSCIKNYTPYLSLPTRRF
jgi:hypothetical protein